MPSTPADARSVADLLSLPSEAPCPDYLLFRGHRKPSSGVSASCLSQFWQAPFTVDGAVYRTAEHYMMAAKARLFGDPGTEQRILAAERPVEAKALGREVAGFDQEVWERARFGVVVDGNTAKFGQNPDLRAFLLGTGARVLVEAAPNDRVWGIGLAVEDEAAQSPAHWRGLNLLGFALMEVRSRLSER